MSIEETISKGAERNQVYEGLKKQTVQCVSVDLEKHPKQP